MAAKVAKGALLGSFALSATLLALEVTGVTQLAGASGGLRGQRRLQQTGMQNGMQNGMHNGMQNGMQTMQNGYNDPRYQNPNKYDPSSANSFLSSSFQFAFLVCQVIFSVVYYCTVVTNYPYWFGPSPMSCELQAQPAPMSLTQTSPTNCCLSWLCPQARASHTFDKTGTLEYWCGLVAMFFCPFCTLCYANACTDLNPKLGGQPQNVCASMACTWCCSCCVIAQDAESLDAATGVRTEFCGVSGNSQPMPYGGGMGMGGPPGMGMGMGGPPGMGMGGPPMAGPYGGGPYGGGMAPGMMGMYPQY